MNLPSLTADHGAGQPAWTRALARDLFPDIVTPFHWTLVQQSAQAAMHRAWAELGVTLPAADLWHRSDDGRVYLNARPLQQAGQSLRGAAWLVVPPDGREPGLLSRLQTPGIIRRVQQQIAAAARTAADRQARLADWLARTQRLRWTQANLLQVMEELEPQAEAALAAWFVVRAGLAAAQAAVTTGVAQIWPDCPSAVVLHLYAGLRGLPGAEAAHDLAAVGRAADPEAALQQFLAAYGHRGPGEVGPAAQRWADHPDRARALACQTATRTWAAAEAARVTAEQTIAARAGPGWPRLEPIVARARDLCRAADLAWDGYVRVMAAAQTWLHAVAGEARMAGLIADVTEANYLELEELKQVATGEWHRGRSAAVRAEVGRRRARWAAGRPEPPQSPQVASPGQAVGPLVRLPPVGEDALPAQAILLMDTADPGLAPIWLAAAGLLDAAGDPWSPGMIIARTLAVPAISGIPPALRQAPAGSLATLNADADRGAWAAQVA